MTKNTLPLAGEIAIENAPQQTLPIVSDSVAHAGHAGVEPGTVIGGVYRVLGPLGNGSMGMVLLAHDETLDRRVAIKFVRKEILDDNFRERFMTEARAMARVSHANVLQIHAFGEHDGSPYFVMELVEGVTLEDWLAQNSSPPPFDVALQILEGICDGVSAIHAAHTVHRDLKPSNVLLDANLRPRIADLGLALFCRPDRPSKPEIVGTPAYMAPETIFSEQIAPALSSRADVYSLACLAYELFTGRPPFQAESNMGLMVQHATTPVPSPSNFRGGLRPELDEAFLRALAKDPAERTATAEAFRRDIISACRGEREPVRILVAEDNDDFRGALEAVLTAEFSGADVECVADGRAALEAFDRKAPSVAILDLWMPGIDGLELTRLIRARDTSATTPIIILTASGGSEEWKQLADSGADRFLVKPVVLDDVVTLVRRSLNERAKGVEQPTSRLTR
ncbi:MAG: protein kinase [Myxococcota bacterium]|nr:protein kinase [Myxococcota bacterium]